MNQHMRWTALTGSQVEGIWLEQIWPDYRTESVADLAIGVQIQRDVCRQVAGPHIKDIHPCSAIIFATGEERN